MASLTLLALLVGACGGSDGEGAPGEAPSAPGPPIEEVELRAGSYRVLCPGGAQDVEAGPGASGRDRIDSFDVTFAEATGDGDTDALVRVTCVTTGQDGPGGDSIIVLRSGPGGPVQVGGPIEGTEAEVVAKRRLAVTRTVDATTALVVPLTLEDDAWVEQASDEPVTTSERVVTSGLGALRIGDTYGEVADEAGRPVAISPSDAEEDDCVVVSLPGDPGRVRGLGQGGTLRSIEVDDPTVRTQSGLGVGTTEAKVEAAFPDRVTRLPRADGQPGSFLVFKPIYIEERLVVFESDGDRVTRYRVGEPAWAVRLGGCG